MKEKLALLYGKTLKFEAIFARYGTRMSKLRIHPDPIPTALLKCVMAKPRGQELQEVAEHVWIRDASCLPPCNPGERLSFKGYVDMFAKNSDEVDMHIVKIEDAKVVRNGKARG